MALSGSLGHVQGGLIIQAGILEVSQGLVRLATQAIERGSGRNQSALCCIQGSCYMLDGSTRSVEALRLFPGTLPILQRFLPCTRLVSMIGQVCHVCIEA